MRRRSPNSTTSVPGRVSRAHRLNRQFLRGGRLLAMCIGALACALLSVASFPKFSVSWLGWICLAPFFWGLTKARSWWGAFFYGWFTGLLCNAGLLYWIYVTCLDGGGLSVGLSAAAWLGLSALLALQFALLGGSCFYLKRTGFYFPFLAACGFVALEGLHQLIAFYGLGFPWIMWGYSQWNEPAVLQLAAFSGVYGVSFVLVFVSACLGSAFAAPPVRKKRYVFMGVLVCALTFVWGSARLPRPQDKQSTDRFQPLLSASVALMQPNIDQYKKWDEAFEQEINGVLTQLNAELVREPVRLAVWPESTVPGTLLEENYYQLFKSASRQADMYQIVGSNVFEPQTQYVGAYLLAPDRDTLQSYHKIKLVPFGEYLPFENVLRRVLPDVEALGGLGVFTPGEPDQPPFEIDGIQVGRTVCYEAIFPALWRAQNKQGTKLFVNLTNDAWFFDTSAPYQHLAANVLRAVETGRPVLRAANTGFSAVIDPFGRIRQRSELFTRTVLRDSVPIQLTDRVNFYTQWGDWFVWLCAVVFFSILISTMVFFYE